jgi:hypothetical protein
MPKFKVIIEVDSASKPQAKVYAEWFCSGRAKVVRVIGPGHSTKRKAYGFLHLDKTTGIEKITQHFKTQKGAFSWLKFMKKKYPNETYRLERM